MTIHKTETLQTENFEADVQLIETDRERFKVSYSLWRVKYWTIPFTDTQLVLSRNRIDFAYYGPPHSYSVTVDDALEVFEDCKDHLMARMEKREEHLEELSS